MPLNFPEDQRVIFPPSGEVTDAMLVAMRRQIFARESRYQKNQKQFDFPLKEGGSVIDTAHQLARGIDSFRAALAIFEAQASVKQEPIPTLRDAFRRSGPTPEFQKMQDFENAKASFTDFFNTVSALEGVENALEKAREAREVLNKQLTEALGVNQKALTFVREVLYKKTFGKGSARVFLEYAETDAQPSSYHRYKPVRFKDVPNSPFEKGVDAPWSQALIKKFGPWMKPFIKENWRVLKASQTPGQRYTPGPANVYEARTVVTLPDEKPRSLSSTLLAVTQPLDVKTNPILNFFGILQKEPFEITLYNQRVLFATDGRLKKFAREYHARWKNQLMNKKVQEITLPILHQSLIADAIPGTPDWKKASMALDYKARANRELRKEFEKYDYYVHRKSGDLVMKGKNGPLEKDFDKAHVKVNFRLLETNNCVNQHHKYSRQRRCDVMDARELVALAVAHLERSWGKNLTKDQKIIRNFLTSRNHSVFTPYRYRGRDVKDAMRRLTENKDDIGLLLSAAVELKCTVHETLLGAARRNFHNFMPSIPGLRWVFVGVSFVLSNLAKLPAAPFLMRRWLQHNTTRRKSFYKATYEQIVAGLLGVSHSGCMSALDRAGEVDIFRAALFEDYCKTGQLLGFNDAPEKKDKFVEQYAQHAQVKKDLAFLATGVPANSNGELFGFSFWFGLGFRGFISQQQSKEFRKVETTTSELRKDRKAAKSESLPSPVEQSLNLSKKIDSNFKLPSVSFFKSYSTKPTEGCAKEEGCVTKPVIS